MSLYPRLHLLSILRLLHRENSLHTSTTALVLLTEYIFIAKYPPQKQLLFGIARIFWVKMFWLYVDMICCFTMFYQDGKDQPTTLEYLEMLFKTNTSRFQKENIILPMLVTPIPISWWFHIQVHNTIWKSKLKPLWSPSIRRNFSTSVMLNFVMLLNVSLASSNAGSKYLQKLRNILLSYKSNLSMQCQAFIVLSSNILISIWTTMNQKTFLSQEIRYQLLMHLIQHLTHMFQASLHPVIWMKNKTKLL